MVSIETPTSTVLCVFNSLQKQTRVCNCSYAAYLLLKPFFFLWCCNTTNPDTNLDFYHGENAAQYALTMSWFNMWNSKQKLKCIHYTQIIVGLVLLINAAFSLQYIYGQCSFCLLLAYRYLYFSINNNTIMMLCHLSLSSSSSSSSSLQLVNLVVFTKRKMHSNIKKEKTPNRANACTTQIQRKSCQEVRMAANLRKSSRFSYTMR